MCCSSSELNSSPASYIEVNPRVWLFLGEWRKKGMKERVKEWLGFAPLVSALTKVVASQADEGKILFAEDQARLDDLAKDLEDLEQYVKGFVYPS